MSNSALPNGLETQEPASHVQTGLKKKHTRKIPRNPLISLDSNERIQGNPKKSNPHKLGFPR
jgi:hypothetical protein